MSIPNNHSKKENIDLIDLLKFFWKDKYKILSITILIAAGSLFYSISLPNIYTSSVTLAPNSEDKSMPSLGSYSALAGIAGIGIPGESGSKSAEAIERLQSLEFFEKHFLPNINLEDIYAVRSWNSVTDDIEYDNSLFNSNENIWVRKVDPPFKSKPSTQEAYKIYRDIFSLSEDKKTKFVILSIKHQSANLANEWLKIIVKNINESMRYLDQKRAKDAINFLNNEAQITKLSELNNAIGELLESQMQTLMVTSISEEYVYKVLRASYASETKSSPNRFSILFLSIFLGIILGFLFSIFNYIKFKRLLDD
jgi:capsular polysaccharide biosynthesis protein